MNSKRFFLEFSYAGSAYHGWQRQPNAVTVQEVMEEVLNTLLKKMAEDAMFILIQTTQTPLIVLVLV